MKSSRKTHFKLDLKFKIGLGIIAFSALVAGVTAAATPWSEFHKNSFVGYKDWRFYSYSNYDKLSEDYQNSIYNQLRSGDNSKTDSIDGQASAAGQTSSSPVSTPAPVAAKSATSKSSSTTTSTAMANITIAEADNSPYTRSDYGSGWEVSGLSCNIRATILQQTSLVATQTATNGCTVTYGSWIDPYSGAILTGNPYQGDGAANDLDIDHIIPLSYVNSHGGYSWSSSAKIAYGKSVAAMNNGVYLAVSASENRKKGDSGPADYYPSNPDFYCEYSKRWRDTARTYAISLSARDYDKIQGVLAECNIN